MYKAILLALVTLMSGISQVPSIQLKESARVGGLEFTAEKVELRPVKIRQATWTSDVIAQTPDKYLVFTYRLTNVTEEQAIDPSLLQAVMEDQFGNPHHQVFGYMLCPQCEIEEPLRGRELLPGDSQRLVAVFQAPKIEKAELFTIKTSFVVDNKSRRGEVWILFNKSDIIKK